ncbi:uncharacterized protein TNCV_1758171 [Trichonephila clavipes]|nr:uncharacterized protein TNCV_1758171 [Trichonephila clavipes]
MITKFFIPELNNHDVQELWFQQDGATCHTARATIDLMKDTLGDRLISRFGPVNWPPRSCDLTPLDYFLWTYAKSLNSRRLCLIVSDSKIPWNNSSRWKIPLVATTDGQDGSPIQEGVNGKNGTIGKGLKKRRFRGKQFTNVCPYTNVAESRDTEWWHLPVGHTDNCVRAFCEEHQDEFPVLPWTANSPDINPIESEWDTLDRVVHALYPHPRKLAQLATTLELTEFNIPENSFRNLIDSVPACLAVRWQFWFLTGSVKSSVYADKPQTLDNLEDNIRRVIADIRPQMLEKVIENWTSRLDYIRASRGSHMPEIIFKM